MIIEVIAIRTEDIEAAAEGGADRIELVTGIAEGGLTPSIGLVEAAVKASALPVNVMVRPHSQSFCYSEPDLAIMIRDIEAIRGAGAAGVVIGVLTAAGEIDKGALERLLRAAEGLDVTFHRAFDEVADPFAVLEELSQYTQISRILTAGGTHPAPQSIVRLRKLREAGEALEKTIMGGYGLNAYNIADFVKETGLQEVHFGSGARRNGSFMEAIEPNYVAHIRKLIGF